MQDEPAVEDVDDQSDRQPAEPGPARSGLLHDDDEPRGAGADRSEDREQRPVDAPETEVRTDLERLGVVARVHAQGDHRQMRDRE
jgi:hypothetical protein